MRQAPICALFPYTTLFRSSDVFDRRGGERPARRVELERPPLVASRDPDRRVCLARRDGNREPQALLAALPPALQKQDRKSTRLNSSHRCISYAVFCLKQKN